MTRTRAIILIVVIAFVVQVGGTLGLMAVGAEGGTALTLPALAAVVFAGLAVGEVGPRYGRKADRRT